MSETQLPERCCGRCFFMLKSRLFKSWCVKKEDCTTDVDACDQFESARDQEGSDQ